MGNINTVLTDLCQTLVAVEGFNRAVGHKIPYNSMSSFDFPYRDTRKRPLRMCEFWKRQLELTTKRVVTAENATTREFDSCMDIEIGGCF